MLEKPTKEQIYEIVKKINKLLEERANNLLKEKEKIKYVSR